jgi:phosphoenolpyruvate-protein phosphotransferase
MSEVTLAAPMAGWLTPLNEVPDPVFADGMMGPGVAIDPTDGVVRSPADATIVSIPDSAHAVTLRLENGAELLIHVGLETVALKGAGFRAISSAGAQVKAGDPLIEVDLAAVADGARSLVTPIVLASEGFELELEAASRPVAAGERIGVIRGTGASATNPGGESYERVVRIGAPNGLHARPAARIAALVKQQSVEVTANLGGRSANARSTVALMSLGVKQGDDLRLVGRGEWARTAIDAVVGLIEAGLGEPQAAAAIAPRRMGGPICASPGLAIGTIFQLRTADLAVPRGGAGEASERLNLAQAIQTVADELSDSGAGDLAAAHRELLDDPELRTEAEREISEGRSAAFAWRSACGSAREALVATGNDLLAERAADLLDIERQVLRALLGGEGAVPDLPSEAIVIAVDLLPSEFLALDKAKLSGICTAEGGPTSHVAILAAAAGVPMIVAAGPQVLSLPNGEMAVLDADRCRLETTSSDERLNDARDQMQKRSAQRAAEVRQAQEVCFTADGVRIEVFANLASVDDAGAAVKAGAEGCGLLRTEFLAIGRNSAPDEEEQRQAYAAIAAALGDRPLIVRTFDIGADKKVSYLGTAVEENPALGLRGVRLSLARPDLLATQLRAIVRGVSAAQRRIMLPMISDLEEFRAARAVLREAEAAVGSQGETPLGIMVETPASALLARELASEAAFLSVGTNDLAQYALAADRTNCGVSAMLDGLHPAVLRLIRLAAEGATAHNRWLGACGGLASDPVAVPILLGLGVTELSVAPAAVPTIKATVRTLRLDDCRKLAERACAASSAAGVRAIAGEAIA